jgi:hypothetical protein
VTWRCCVTSHIAWEWGCAYIYKCTLMTQRVLKLWWSWTYQNFAVKSASTRVIPGWVTSWEVWFGRAKSGQYCIIGGGSLQMVSEPLPSMRWWECAQAYDGCQRTLAGTPRMGWSHEGRQQGRKVPRGVIVTSHIAWEWEWEWEWECAYMHKCTLMTQRVLK